MFEGKIEKSIIIITTILFVILSVGILFSIHRLNLFFGLAAGGGFSILRLKTSAVVLKKIISEGNGSVTTTSIIRYVLSLMATMLLLIVSALYDMWLLLGVSSGILLVPAAILIYGILAGFGFVHIDFE